MKHDWHSEELALHWTLSESELELLGTKTGATRLSFAILLKAFQLDGRFPDRREDVSGSIVGHLASQTGAAGGLLRGRVDERRYQRALIREHCGFRAFHAKDERPSIRRWRPLRSPRTTICARSTSNHPHSANVAARLKRGSIGVHVR